MNVYLLGGFGSTYTKITAADLDEEDVLERAQPPTTAGTDVSLGMRNALAEMKSACGIDESAACERYASSSAAGGFKMAAIGLVPELALGVARSLRPSAQALGPARKP